MKPISGEPQRDKYALPPSQAQRDYKLDLVRSDSLEEIEAGIKETARRLKHPDPPNSQITAF